MNIQRTQRPNPSPTAFSPNGKLESASPEKDVSEEFRVFAGFTSIACGSLGSAMGTELGRSVGRQFASQLTSASPSTSAWFEAISSGGNVGAVVGTVAAGAMVAVGVYGAMVMAEQGFRG